MLCTENLRTRSADFPARRAGERPNPKGRARRAADRIREEKPSRIRASGQEDQGLIEVTTRWCLNEGRPSAPSARVGPVKGYLQASRPIPPCNRTARSRRIPPRANPGPNRTSFRPFSDLDSSESRTTPYCSCHHPPGQRVHRGRRPVFSRRPVSLPRTRSP